MDSLPVSRAELVAARVDALEFLEWWILEVEDSHQVDYEFKELAEMALITSRPALRPGFQNSHAFQHF